MKIIEALSREEEHRILDIEHEILTLKRDLLEAPDFDKERIKDRIEYLKQEIVNMKERGKDNGPK